VSGDDTTPCCSWWPKAVYVVVILGTFLLVGGLAKLMIHYLEGSSPGAARAEERYKNLAEYRQTVAPELENYAMQDPTKGVVRLPMARAMELTVQEWSDAASGRASLLERYNKANPPPPPPPVFE